MNKARENILNRLHDQSSLMTDETVNNIQEKTWTKNERTEHFCTMLRKAHAEVHRLPDNQYVDWLNQELPKRGIKRVLAGDNALGRKISELTTKPLKVQLYQQAIEEWKELLFNEVDIAITGCKGGIAESGSLILWPDAEEPRLMSLVPPVHLIVMHERTLFSNFSEAMQEQQWSKQMPTNALLISGPSKTADIEQILAYGIHGPKTLIVLLLY